MTSPGWNDEARAQRAGLTLAEIRKVVAYLQDQNYTIVRQREFCHCPDSCTVLVYCDNGDNYLSCPGCAMQCEMCSNFSEPLEGGLCLDCVKELQQEEERTSAGEEDDEDSMNVLEQ